MTNVVNLVPKAAKPRSTAPRGLSKSARKLWEDLAPTIRLTAETSALLAAYVGAIDLITDCDRELRGAKKIIKGPSGIPRPHPLIGARNRAAQNALQLAKRLGIGREGSAPKSKGGSADGDPYSDLGI